MAKLPHWPIPYASLPKEKTLRRMEYLLEKMGNPHHNLRNIIHVAGTNGKGSTIAFLETILRHAGYRVDKYTSPHLVNFNERIILNGKQITDQILYKYIEKARIANDGNDITFFEGTTAAAFAAFAESDADILLLETGMGGQLDATNIIKSPLVSVITPISYDHTEFLGETLYNIATHKSGIIKNKSKCVISWQYQEALKALLERCQLQQVGCYVCGHHWNFINHPEQNSFVFHNQEQEISLPLPNLFGFHQVINAATAIATIECLDDFEVSYNDINYGITHAQWPARMQLIQNQNINTIFPNTWEIWIDGAHNVAGAEMLSLIVRHWQDCPVILINGRTKDRDIEGFLTPFQNMLKAIIAVPIEYEPKSEDPNKIAQIAENMGFAIYTAENVVDALKVCYKIYQDQKIRVLITGSLYLASDLETISRREEYYEKAK